MVKHVVMWKLKGLDEGYDPRITSLKLKETLESMGGQIEGLVSIQAGINKNESSDAYDVCLISEHRTWQDLKNYQEHPLHKKVAEFVTEIRKARKVVDYEY